MTVPAKYTYNGYKFRCVVTGQDNKTVTSSAVKLTVTGWYNLENHKRSSSYLNASTDCQVNNSKIKAAAQKGVLYTGSKAYGSAYKSGNAPTSTKVAATRLMNYLNSITNYGTVYYNTKYGAVGTLRVKKTNCVDMAHLAVACARSVGIPARYVHSSGAYFYYSKKTYGHVWAQWYVAGKWYNVDLTGTNNTFGSIKNHNAKNIDSYPTAWTARNSSYVGK